MQYVICIVIWTFSKMSFLLNLPYEVTTALNLKNFIFHIPYTFHIAYYVYCLYGICTSFCLLKKVKYTFHITHCRYSINFGTSPLWR